MKLTKKCLYPWSFMQFHAGGMMQPCAVGADTDMGDFIIDYLEKRPENKCDFLNNEGLQKLRKGMLTGDLRPMCQNCFFISNELQTIQEFDKQLKEYLLGRLPNDIDIECVDLTKIYAYDTDETARSLCLQMAKLNQVEDKLIIKKTCTAADLKDFKFNGKSLIICDCEGYEHILFNASNIKNLANCDLLIETHDFLDLNISIDLDKLFNKTHHIQTIKSIDDIEKVKTYFYQETNGLTLEKKLKIYQECRPSIIEWLYCTPKK